MTEFRLNTLIVISG